MNGVMNSQKNLCGPARSAGNEQKKDGPKPALVDLRGYR